MMRKLLLIVAFLSALALWTGCGNGKNENSILKPAEGSTVTSAQILDALCAGQPIHIKGCTIQGFLDFTKIGGGSSYVAVAPSYVDADIVFANCVFEDSVSSFTGQGKEQRVYTVFNKNVVFQECEFKHGVNFTQADFRGRFDFDVSKVQGDAAFDGCRFRDGSSFAMANFNGEVTFVSTTFGGRTNFMKSFFRKPVVFQRCKTEDVVMFADSHFYGYTEFSHLVCYDDLDFSNSQFADRLVMARSVYLGNIKMANCVMKGNVECIGNTFAEPLVSSGAQLPDGGLDVSGNQMLQKSDVECFKIK